jgi:cysteine synthase A
MNQFENPANYMAHYKTTGPEIYAQIMKDNTTQQSLHAFVMSCGTGGTLSGVGRYLKEQDPSIRIILVDPPGSCLYNKVKYGVAFTKEQRERSLKRHRYDTIAEGIGLDRITSCVQFGLDVIDDAVRVSDQEAVDMAHWILKQEGLFVGSSSAMNLVGAVRTAKQLPEKSNIVTIVCDSGQRHLTRFWNRDFIVNQQGLQWPGDDDSSTNRSNVLPMCML